MMIFKRVERNRFFMYLTEAQKQKFKIRFYLICREIITRSSLYFLAGLFIGMIFVTNQVTDWLVNSPLNELITSCDAVINKHK